jgi:hypothetical protein
MPWSKLDYDTELGGHRVDVTEDQLRGAPKFSRSTDWDWSNRTNDERVLDTITNHSGTKLMAPRFHRRGAKIRTKKFDWGDAAPEVLE